MIRNRIVVGIRDEAMSQKLQLDADLTLEAAKKMVRQREAVRAQQVQLRSGFQEEGLPVEAIGNTGAGVRSQKFNRRAKPFSKTTESAMPPAHYPQKVYKVWQGTAPQTALPSQRSHMSLL